MDVNLTDQERSIIALVADGKTNQEVADTLGIRYSTASGYLKQIYNKVRVRTRGDLTAWAIKEGLVKV